MFLHKHFYKLFIVVILVSLGLVTYIWQTEAAIGCQGDCVQIRNTVIPVEIVDDFESRRIGLSYRKSMDPSSGMLFVMPSKSKSSFWMKDMNFPLDIIWIHDNKIVNIHKNLQPEGENPVNSYSSKFPVNYVLEVNAGYANAFGLVIGEEINIYREKESL